MKKHTCILVTLSLLTCFTVSAQKGGLFGRTAFVEVSGLANLNVLNNLTNNLAPFYEKSGVSGVQRGNDWFNQGVTFAAGIAPKRNFAIGVETGLHFFSIAGPDYTYFHTNSGGPYAIPIRHESVDVRTLTIMPIFEFAGNGCLLPVGVSHQAGIGYASSQAIEKDYAYEPELQTTSYNDDNGNYVTADSKQLLDSLNQQNGGLMKFGTKYKGTTLMYALKVRVPVSKRIMINYGLRYTLNFTSTGSDAAYYSYYTAEGDPTGYYIKKARIRSVINLSLGVTFAL